MMVSAITACGVVLNLDPLIAPFPPPVPLRPRPTKQAGGNGSTPGETNVEAEDMDKTNQEQDSLDPDRSMMVLTVRGGGGWLYVRYGGAEELI